jgi:hypothetical protein
MKNYIIGFSYVEFAKVQVQAETQEDAERRVYEQLEEQGIPDDADVFDREYSVDCGEEKDDES